VSSYLPMVQTSTADSCYYPSTAKVAEGVDHDGEFVTLSSGHRVPRMGNPLCSSRGIAHRWAYKNLMPPERRAD